MTLSTVLQISLVKTNYMARPTFTWRGDVYSYIWRRKGAGNLASALMTLPTSVKSQHPYSHGVCFPCKMEADNTIIKTTPYICQFQNLINVMKRLKQGNVIKSDWVAICGGQGRTL